MSLDIKFFYKRINDRIDAVRFSCPYSEKLSKEKFEEYQKGVTLMKKISLVPIVGNEGKRFVNDKDLDRIKDSLNNGLIQIYLKFDSEAFLKGVEACHRGISTEVERSYT